MHGLSHIYVDDSIVQKKLHAVVYGDYIFIIFRLVPTRLDETPVKRWQDHVNYSTDTSHINGIEHIIAGHRRGEGNTSVRVDEDRRTLDWAPTRRKSTTFINVIRLSPDVTMAFRQYDLPALTQ